MRRTGIALGLVVAVACAAVHADDPKYTNKEVMKHAHVGNQNSLLMKVQSGRATDEDKAKLVELYESMVKNKPKKGDADGFTKLAETILTAAKAAQSGEKDAGPKLVKAANCKACHNLYK